MSAANPVPLPPATVSALSPGDRIVQDGPEGMVSAVFVAQAPHPLYPGLRLVIWKLDDGSWSFDALRPGQEVGQWEPGAELPGRRRENLARALLSEENAAAYLGRFGEPSGE